MPEPTNERYGGSAKSRSVWYHGTSPRNLRSIMSQGLIPDPKHRNWGDDEGMSVLRATRQSLPGIYLTRNLTTATSAPRRSGDEGVVVVAVELTTRAALPDEDSLRYSLELDAPAGENSYVIYQQYFLYRAGLPAWEEVLDGAVARRRDTALRLAGNESRAADVILQRIRQHYGTLLTRQVSHLASGNPRWHWEFHRAVSGIADASIDPDVVLDADKDGNVRGVARAFLPPSVPSAERAWLGAVDAIVRAAKRTIPHQDSFSPTLRVTEPIRFSGSNRIVCVARITQTPEFQRYLRSGFQSDRRFTGPSTLVQVYYGKPPDDMLKQVAERKGEYRVEYARSLSEGAVRLRVSSLTEAAEAVRRFTLRKWAAARYVLEWDDGSTTVLDAPRALRMAGLDPDEHIPPTVRDLDEADASALPPDDGTQWRDATGDVVAGDVIRFREAVFKGSFRSPKFVGERTITARVEKESYGADKQQHTFSLRVISSDGIDPLKAGERTRRKGRNIYRNGTERLVWRDEEARRAVADEKHRRGDAARQVRRWRIGESDGLATAFDAPRRSWPGTYLDIGHGDSPVTLWWVDRQWGWHTRSLRFGGEAYHLDPSLASGRATERVVSVSPHPRLAGSPLDRVLEMVRRRFPGRLIVLFTHYGARGEIVDEAVLASPSGPSQS